MKNILAIFFAFALQSHALAAKVALYSGAGVWAPSLKHTEKLLLTMGHHTLRITAKDILSRRLDLGDINAIVIPGGKSWLYRNDLDSAGGEAIRKFVERGGGYIGFCAGAFFATRLREGGNTTGPYGIGLLDGTAVDPESLGFPGYQKGMKTINYHLADFKEKYRVIYLAGPIFRYSQEEASLKKIQVNSTYWDGQVAGIHFQYGNGHVYLSGPHPEVEERLNFLLALTRPDPDSEWPIVKQLVTYALDGIEPKLRDQSPLTP